MNAIHGANRWLIFYTKFLMLGNINAILDETPLERTPLVLQQQEFLENNYKQLIELQ